MIEFKKGDILDEEAEALVNTVNCVGVMGRGIALQFKRAFPENFKDYAVRCKRNEVQPGRMLVFETREMFTPRYIINFPTKRHWRGKSRIEDIESGLRSLAEEVRSRGIRSIAIPPLGSGLGGLSWSDVRDRLEEALNESRRRQDCRVRARWWTRRRRCESLARRAHNDERARGARWIAGSIPLRSAGPLRDPAGSPQTHVLHAGSRRTAAAPVHRGPLRTLR